MISDSCNIVIISTHTLRKEGDDVIQHTRLTECISTHTLRKEGDQRKYHSVTSPTIFQPTPSARRVTNPLPFRATMQNISTHTLRKEGDLLQLRRSCKQLNISTHTLRKEGDSKSIQFKQ